MKNSLVILIVLVEVLLYGFILLLQAGVALLEALFQSQLSHQIVLIRAALAS